MRRGMKAEFIRDETRSSQWPREQVKIKGDTGLLLGVNLGADYCAEHEWGIKSLKQSFGILDDISIYGVARRQVSIVPENLAWVEFRSTYFAGSQDVAAGRAEKKGDIKLSNAGFIFHSWYAEEPEKLAKNSELGFGIGLRGAWSDCDFAAVSSNPDDIQALKEIFIAFRAGDAILTFGKAMPVFENPGLVIAIASRLPALVCEQLYEADRDYHRLRQEVEATGIEASLKAAGKHYFALSPRRQGDGSIRYWLNPCEQRENACGWFTLADLQDWAQGKGRIIIPKVEAGREQGTV